MILLLASLAASVPNAPIARGPNESVKAMLRAARKCGMRDLRFDQLDDERAMLLIGKRDRYRSVDCTLNWMKMHWDELQLEPLFVGNLAD